jgi:hypothetical protein
MQPTTIYKPSTRPSGADLSQLKKLLDVFEQTVPDGISNTVLETLGDSIRVHLDVSGTYCGEPNTWEGRFARHVMTAHDRYKEYVHSCQYDYATGEQYERFLSFSGAAHMLKLFLADTPLPH